MKRIAANMLFGLACVLNVFAILKWLFGGEKKCLRR